MDVVMVVMWREKMLPRLMICNDETLENLLECRGMQ